ncbi:MAG: ATP-binding protein, partial [Spirochaetaceae bacterium]
VRLARLADERSRRINLQIISDPGVLTEEDFLEKLDPDLEPLALVVRVEDELIYRSDILEGGVDTETLERYLPAFGQIRRGFLLPGDAPATEPPPLSDPPLSEPTVSEPAVGEPRAAPPRDATTRDTGRPRAPLPLEILSHWDFRTPEGEEGSIFLLQTDPRVRRRAPSFGVVVALGAGFILVLANGTLSLFLISRLTRPLRRLEQAALTMSEGRFDEPVAPPPVREMTQVFHAFETLRSRLRELLESRSRDEESRHALIAGLSHDLKTPVTAIKGYVEGLRDGVANTPEKRERYLNTIHQKINVLEKMISELFFLASLQGREPPLDLRPIDVAGFLSDSVEEFRTMRAAPEQEIRGVGLERSDVVVNADPIQLRRAVENVLDNALKYAQSDGTPLQVTLSLEAARERVTISIEDDGRGIPSEQVPRVFDSSFRGDAARSVAGSGLGLTIARRIVELHGGRIYLQSAEGAGTSVRIQLPRAEASS